VPTPRLANKHKEVATILRKVHRGHINALEALIQRYQLDLDKTFDATTHAIELAVNDSGHLAIVLNNLVSEFRKLGIRYIQEAADLGYTRALADLKDRGWVRKYQTPVYAPKESLVEVLRANQDYLQKSLLPDMHKRFSGAANVRAGINALRSRVAMYGHYLWTTAEKSYKYALSTFDKSRAKNLKESIRLIEVGGPGSGDKGHQGRKGQVGGSAPSEKAAPGAEGYSGQVAPWDMKADAEPRYKGDTSIFSPAIKDAQGNYALGRRLQGEQTGKDPNNQVAMFTFIPGSATQDQLKTLEGMIQANSDHAQLHPGEIAFNSQDGLQKVPGNLYWVRGDLSDVQNLDQQITPAVREAFGDKSAWTVMMTDKTPGGTDVTSGQEVNHMRVVVPFEKGTPENTVGTPSVSAADRDKILSIMAGENGRAWQHADFNGIHIATNTTPDAAEAIGKQVRALGGQQDHEGSHADAHSVGATRFIPTDVNIENYPVREVIRLKEVGGPGSGDHGHEGRKGAVGGSAPSSAAIAKAAYDAIQKQGGVTISVRGEVPKKGFAVAGIGATEKVIEAVTLKDVREYMRANKAILAEPRRFLGAWVSDGKTYLDVPEIIPDRDEALKTATARGELAIYDLGAGAEISTGVVREAEKSGAYRIIFGKDQTPEKVFEALQEHVGRRTK
jgi:hypothetical protein